MVMMDELNEVHCSLICELKNQTSEYMNVTDVDIELLKDQITSHEALIHDYNFWLGRYEQHKKYIIDRRKEIYFRKDLYNCLKDGKDTHACGCKKDKHG